MERDLEKNTGVIPPNDSHSIHLHRMNLAAGTQDDVDKEADRDTSGLPSEQGDTTDNVSVDEDEERARQRAAAAAAAAATTASDAAGQPDKDPFEVVWSADHADPECPQNMSTARKWLIMFVTCMGSTCVTCASSIYTSSYGKMNAEFGSSRIVATLGLSTFVLGIAAGPGWSPLSEFYGRRPIYLGSFFLFLVWIVPAAVAPNVETVIVARFFQGFTGSAFLSVSGGTVSDLYTRETMQGPMAFFSAAPFVGPSLGPILGGFINARAGWRWTHYVLLLWAGAELVALALCVPETYHPVLLRNRARRLRQTTGDDRWRAPIERLQRSLAATVAHALLRPFQMLLREPMCMALDLYSALLLGILYLFFGAFQLVFARNHGFSLWQVGLTFVGMLLGMVVGAATFPVWGHIRHRLMARRQRRTGEPALRSEPEDRLPQLMAGALLVPAGLFWFGWSTYAHVHWIVPIIGSGVFAVGVLLAFSSIFTFLIDAYAVFAASALAGNMFVRCIFAAAFPLFGVQMYEKLGYQWATSLLAFLSVAMVPFPFLFFKYGKQLRDRSRFAVKI